MKYIALAVALAKAMPALEHGPVSDDTAFTLPYLQSTASLGSPQKVRRVCIEADKFHDQKAAFSDLVLNECDFTVEHQISPPKLADGPSVTLMQYESFISTDKNRPALSNIPHKVVVKSFAANDKSFLIEKKIALILGNKSPYIINTYGTFWRDGNNIVMEYGGDDVFHYAYKNLPKIVENESCSRFLMMQIIVAVEYVHSKGYVHNDIKLENFVFKKDAQTIKLIDFGTAKHIKDKNNFKEIATGWNMIYRSPEIAANLLQVPTEVGFASDWYSVGYILYTLMFGRFAYTYDTLIENGAKSSLKTDFLSHLVSGELFKSRIEQNLRIFSERKSVAMVKLLALLLFPSQSRRLGYSAPLDSSTEAFIRAGVKGSTDIKNSAWFSCVDWVVVQRGNEKEIQSMCEKSSGIVTPRRNSDDKCCSYLEKTVAVATDEAAVPG